jgi:hypothetical protein
MFHPLSNSDILLRLRTLLLGGAKRDEPAALRARVQVAGPP